MHNELAKVHIGMLLAGWDKNTTLPTSLKDLNKRIYDIFGVEMWNEPNIEIARNKIIAVIEQIRDEETWH